MAAASALREHDATVSAESSLNNTWYAVAFSEQLPPGGTKPFGTRLWGEPIVLYRDAEGDMVAAKDVCPHRSAPLSMGDVEDGMLRCFYHGWGFGKKGTCEDVPTITSSSEKKALSTSLFCVSKKAVVEHEGIVFVWQGHPLAADVRKLPTCSSPSDEGSFVCDTILDYDVPWSEVVADKLGASHLSRLRPGSMPQLQLIGDGAGAVVRHGDSSGFAEELHVTPIAERRSRVMLRQRFPKGLLLSPLLSMPKGEEMIKFLLRNRNYQIAVEDFKEWQRRRAGAAAGSDAVVRFQQWVGEAQEAEGPSFFTRWDRPRMDQRLGQQRDDSSATNTGTYGLKRNYVQDQPADTYAPMNYAPNKQFHDQQNQAITETAVTGAVSVPAALLTYKTVVPAMATLATTLASVQ